MRKSKPAGHTASFGTTCHSVVGLKSVFEVGGAHAAVLFSSLDASTRSAAAIFAQLLPLLAQNHASAFSISFTAEPHSTQHRQESIKTVRFSIIASQYGFRYAATAADSSHTLPKTRGVLQPDTESRRDPSIAPHTRSVAVREYRGLRSARPPTR